MRPTIPRESLLTERPRIDAALHAALTEIAIPYGVSLSPRAFLDLSPARAVSRAGKPHDALSAQCPLRRLAAAALLSREAALGRDDGTRGVARTAHRRSANALCAFASPPRPAGPASPVHSRRVRSPTR